MKNTCCLAPMFGFIQFIFQFIILLLYTIQHITLYYTTCYIEKKVKPGLNFFGCWVLIVNGGRDYSVNSNKNTLQVNLSLSP